MAAGGFRTFVAGETLDEDKINDFLMQGVLVFDDAAARDVAITSPVHGQVVFRKDDDAIEFYDGTGWEGFSAGGFAEISNTPTGTYTESGLDYIYWEFTANGTLNVTEAGLLDVLVVGGGGGGGRNINTRAGGGAGAVRYGIFDAPTGSITVTVGAGGAGAYTTGGAQVANGGVGSPSSLDSILVSGGGDGGSARDDRENFSRTAHGGGGSGGGVVRQLNGLANGGGAGAAGGTAGLALTYSGTSVTYGVGGSSASTAAAVANTGSGGNTQTNAGTNAGGSGVVIVRVRV